MVGTNSKMRDSFGMQEAEKLPGAFILSAMNFGRDKHYKILFYQI
jgi:hypothetical protein